MLPLRLVVPQMLFKWKFIAHNPFARPSFDDAFWGGKKDFPRWMFIITMLTM